MGLRSHRADVASFAMACSDLDLQNVIRSLLGASEYSLSFIKIAQVVHDIWCSQDLTLTACCNLDLQNQSRSSLRDHANKICLDERMRQTYSPKT